METTACKFYEIVGGEAHAIDAWIDGDQIYSPLHEDSLDPAGRPGTYFFKISEGGGVFTRDCGIAEYGGNIGARRILFEVDRKWGYGNPWSNQIFIAPTYAFAWPFENDGCAVVCKGGVYSDAVCLLDEDSKLKWDGGGRCGLIDENGRPVIPFNYDVLTHIAFEPAEERHDYIAQQGGKWGVLDAENRMRIPFVWDDLYVYQSFFLLGEKDVPCASGTRVSYTLFGKDLQLIADDLDCAPRFCPCHGYSDVDEEDFPQYHLLQKGAHYGIVRNDGALIAPIELSEADARAHLWRLGRTW